MDYQDWEHISDTLETASNALMLALAVVCTAIALPIAIAGSPLYGIYYLLVGRPKEKKAEEERRRKEARKRRKPHATPARTGRFLFRKDRDLKVPRDKIAYVAACPDDRIDRFLRDNAPWLRQWQEWNGIDIIHADAGLLREGMVFPQDFPVFRHGFVWQLDASAGDGINEGTVGNLAFYFDLDPEAPSAMKAQMDRMADAIHEKASRLMM